MIVQISKIYFFPISVAAIARMLPPFVTKMPIAGSSRKIMATNVDVRMVTTKMVTKTETPKIQFVLIIAYARMAPHIVKIKEHV